MDLSSNNYHHPLQTLTFFPNTLNITFHYFCNFQWFLIWYQSDREFSNYFTGNNENKTNFCFLQWLSSANLFYSHHTFHYVNLYLNLQFLHQNNTYHEVHKLNKVFLYLTITRLNLYCQILPFLQKQTKSKQSINRQVSSSILECFNSMKPSKNWTFIIVNMNGSLSHPSDMSAGCTSKWPYKQIVFFLGSLPNVPMVAPSPCNFTSAHFIILTTSFLKSGSADTDLIETAFDNVFTNVFSFSSI
ncbi:hypothetical protein AGLY_010513 [Aphis glycines]|uniref:Uncharacterized protein n=1 Tax=Aphis glycines TaxID=307491 RepID=A0A6G0TFY0_APHGL|nr:hypothetical protein AGLY_010513 [Aphis glycines]